MLLSATDALPQFLQKLEIRNSVDMSVGVCLFLVYCVVCPSIRFAIVWWASRPLICPAPQPRTHLHVLFFALSSLVLVKATHLLNKSSWKFFQKLPFTKVRNLKCDLPNLLHWLIYLFSTFFVFPVQLELVYSVIFQIFFIILYHFFCITFSCFLCMFVCSSIFNFFVFRMVYLLCQFLMLPVFSELCLDLFVARSDGCTHASWFLVIDWLRNICSHYDYCCLGWRKIKYVCHTQASESKEIRSIFETIHIQSGGTWKFQNLACVFLRFAPPAGVHIVLWLVDNAISLLWLSGVNTNRNYFRLVWNCALHRPCTSCLI